MYFVVFPHFFRLLWGKNGENSSSLLGYGAMLNPNELKTETSKLRELGVKVTITQKGGTLYLRCVLPPRPGSIKVKPHRQEVKPLPRGVAANQQGLKIPKKRAIKLWGLLQTGAFNWDDWEKKSSVANPQTVREWVEQFCSYWLSPSSNLFLMGSFKGRSRWTWNLHSGRSIGLIPWLSGDACRQRLSLNWTFLSRLESIDWTKESQSRVCRFKTIWSRFCLLCGWSLSHHGDQPIHHGVGG